METEVLRAPHRPGSQFKGSELYDVQDLQIGARAVHDRRVRWLVPDGTIIAASLPGGIRGHFGPELRRFVLVQCRCAPPWRQRRVHSDRQ